MRCVRMGTRAADESTATEGARPDDGGQDDSGSEVDAWASSEDEEGLDPGAREGPLRDRPKTVHGKGKRGAVRGAFRAAPCACRASLHQYYRTPQPARVTVSVRRSRPPTGHRRAAGGAATTTAPPLPDRRATRGVSSRCDPQQCSRRSPQNLRRGETRNGDCSPLHSPKRCVSPQRRPLAVVKWYRIDAHWYKPDPAALRSGKQNPNLKRSKRYAIPSKIQRGEFPDDILFRIE